MWSHQTSPLVLEDAQVQVWRAPLDHLAHPVGGLSGVLSEDERSRARCFRFDLHRNRFVAGRAILRDILARYLDTPAVELRFHYSEHGKPALAGTFGASGLQFNMTHSAGIALYAVARDRELGIDVEELRPMPDCMAIAELCFSARELGALRAAAPEDREAVFFACWTRKEAYVKAVGEGLSMPLHEIDVPVAPGESGEPRPLRGDAGEASRWSLQELRPAPGFVGAVAVEGADWHLRCLDWML